MSEANGRLKKKSLNREGREGREERLFWLARRANKHVFASFFAVFAILSERSERAVKKRLNREEREGREELHVFVGLRPKRKSLNHEDHEGREEKQIVVGPSGQKFILCDLGGLE